MLRSSPVDRPRRSQAVWLPPPRQVSSKHGATRALAACLAAAAVAAPAALADHLRSPDPRTAAARPAQKRADVITGGVRAPDWLSPNARDAAAAVAPTTGVRRPDAPTVVEVTSAQGFDWPSAAIGAGGAIALALIALAATAAVRSRSRPAPR